MKPRIVVVLAAAAVLIVSAGAHAAYVTDNLVVHLDAGDADAAGNSIASSTDWALWHNLTGSGNDAVFVGGSNDITTAGVGTGVPSDPYAMQFNGTDDGLEFLNLLNLSEESLTYEFWIKADPTMALGVGDRGCLIGEFGGTKNFLQLTTPNCSWLNSGAQFDQWPGAGDASYKQVAGMPMEAWYQLVVTKDGSALTFYVNGTEFSSGTNEEVYTGSEPTVAAIGKRPGTTHYYKGLMGLVRVYDAPLSAAQVEQNFNNDSATFGVQGAADPNAYWTATGTENWLTAANWDIDGAPGVPAGTNLVHINNGGTCYVDGAAAAANITLGYDSGDSGALEIRNGGSLSAGDVVRIGRAGTGSLTLEDGGAVTITAEVIVASHGTGGTYTQNGGTATIAALLLGNQPGSQGLAEIKGGELNCPDKLVVGEDVGGGTLVQTGGAVTVPRAILGELEGSSGKYEIRGGSLQVTDRIQVGAGGSGELLLAGSGATSISVGDYRQNSQATLTALIDAAGITPIQVAVGDAAFAEGALLDVAFADGTSAYAGTWTLLEVLGETALLDGTLAFAETVDTDLSDGTGWSMNFDTVEMMLSVTYADGGGIEGDLDGDGFVGSSDLDIVRGNWGSSVTAGDLLSGDPSGDGMVGSADLDIIRGNWGATSSAAVPEPGLIALLLLGLATLSMRRVR